MGAWNTQGNELEDNALSTDDQNNTEGLLDPTVTPLRSYDERPVIYLPKLHYGCGPWVWYPLGDGHRWCWWNASGRPPATFPGPVDPSRWIWDWERVVGQYKDMAGGGPV